MLRASQVIQAGRIARRIGEPITAVPLYPCHQQYEEIIIAGKVERVRCDLDWEGLWITGWNIEDRFGERS